MNHLLFYAYSAAFDEQYSYKLSNKFFFESSKLLISLKTCQAPYLEMFMSIL